MDRCVGLAMGPLHHISVPCYSQTEAARNRAAVEQNLGRGAGAGGPKQQEVSGQHWLQMLRCKAHTRLLGVRASAACGHECLGPHTPCALRLARQRVHCASSPVAQVPVYAAPQPRQQRRQWSPPRVDEQAVAREREREERGAAEAAARAGREDAMSAEQRRAVWEEQRAAAERNRRAVQEVRALRIRKRHMQPHGPQQWPGPVPRCRCTPCRLHLAHNVRQCAHVYACLVTRNVDGIRVMHSNPAKASLYTCTLTVACQRMQADRHGGLAEFLGVPSDRGAGQRAAPPEAAGVPRPSGARAGSAGSGSRPGSGAKAGAPAAADISPEARYVQCMITVYTRRKNTVVVSYEMASQDKVTSTAYSLSERCLTLAVTLRSTNLFEGTPFHISPVYPSLSSYSARRQAYLEMRAAAERNRAAVEGRPITPPSAAAAGAGGARPVSPLLKGEHGYSHWRRHRLTAHGQSKVHSHPDHRARCTPQRSTMCRLNMPPCLLPHTFCSSGGRRGLAARHAAPRPAVPPHRPVGRQDGPPGGGTPQAGAGDPRVPEAALAGVARWQVK